MTDKKEIVLITGASGLIGSTLTNFLLSKGYEIKVLGRNKLSRQDVKSYTWDYKTGHIDEGAVINTDYIIHLAGTGVMDKRWSEERKKVIVESRTKTADLLFETVNKTQSLPKAVLSASGINYYGTETTEKIFTEDDPAGKDFLSQCVVEWENSIDRFQSICRTVKLRFGMVLSNKGGGLPAMASPIKWSIGAVLGNGKQYLPWIHVDDVCSMFYHGIINQLNGSYNATAPQHVNNKEFTHLIATVLNRKILLPNVPSFLLKMVLGKRACVILAGSRAHSGKIKSTGYEFNHGHLHETLENLLLKNP